MGASRWTVAGMSLTISIDGLKVLRTTSDRPIAMPRMTPTTAASRNPRRIRCTLASRFS